MYKPPQGGKQGMRRKAEGFPQRFVEWRRIFLLVCLVMLRGKPLIMSIGSFPHKAETLIIFTPHSLYQCVRARAPQGAQGERVWCRALLHGLEHGLLGLCVVCVFTYHFGMLVVRCVCNPFSLFWQTKGHTLIHC